MLIKVLTLTCVANAFFSIVIFGLIKFGNRRRKTLVSVIGGSDWNHPILLKLKQTLLGLDVLSWSKSGQYQSLEGIAPKLEELDSEQTIRTLLIQTAKECATTFEGDIKLSNLEQFTKSVYRLQQLFNLSDSTMADVFTLTIKRVKGSVVLSQKVDTVELIKTDARVSDKTMWPLSYGLRVKQPFGLVLRSKSGDVLSRAKV